MHLQLHWRACHHLGLHVYPHLRLKHQASRGLAALIPRPSGRETSAKALPLCRANMTVGCQDRSFGPYTICGNEIFVETPLSFAFVNLKPVVPGHVLISSKRVEPRFVNLSDEEAADLWKLAKQVGKVTEPHFGATSLTFAIQDGQHAGQSVPHVHIHILPRRPGDFEKNDDVYDAIDANDKDVSSSGEKLDLDAARRMRTPEEMAAEAAELRALFS